MTATPRHGTLPNLPQADSRLLARPPLEVVLCEIRTVQDPSAALGPAEGLRLQELATSNGFTVERLEQAQQQAIEFQIVAGQAATPRIETKSAGWQLIAADGTSVATVLPGVVTIQSNRYTSWDQSFRPLLVGLLTAVDKVLTPSMTQRVGLRYVDRLVDPEARVPAAWRGRVSNSLLGPVADPVLGDRVITAQQQVELAIGEGRRALLRHGPFDDGALHGATSYLIDIDVFDTNTSAFSVSDVLGIADDLNRVALSLFQSSLSTSYLTELQGET